MRPLGDVIVIMPPLAIGLDELAELLTVVEEAIAGDLPIMVAGLENDPVSASKNKDL